MNETNSLIIFTKAAQMLAEADSIQKTKELKDMAILAADWAKRKGMGEEAIQYARSYALEAERKMGEMLAIKPPGYKAGPGRGLKGRDVGEPPFPTLDELKLTKRESAEAQILASIPREEFEEVKSGEKTRADIKRENKRKEIIEHLEDIKVKEAKAIEGLYDVIVIDPPWPMEKIERDVRPNQVEMDYPTMTLGEIRWLTIPHAKDCHVWMWTTQKFLEEALSIFHQRRWKYVCTFVWHKPGGFQPIGLPQFNAEFVIYGRLGHPSFIDTKAFPVCFNAPRSAHSEKPIEFYDMVRRVTAGRRLDMFARQKRKGFDGWGLEADES